MVIFFLVLYNRMKELILHFSTDGNTIDKKNATLLNKIINAKISIWAFMRTARIEYQKKFYKYARAYMK